MGARTGERAEGWEGSGWGHALSAAPNCSARAAAPSLWLEDAPRHGARPAGCGERGYLVPPVRGCAEQSYAWGCAGVRRLRVCVPRPALRLRCLCSPPSAAGRARSPVLPVLRGWVFPRWALFATFLSCEHLTSSRYLPNASHCISKAGDGEGWGRVDTGLPLFLRPPELSSAGSFSLRASSFQRAA